jgi:hypothetical protein
MHKPVLACRETAQGRAAGADCAADADGHAVHAYPSPAAGPDAEVRQTAGAHPVLAKLAATAIDTLDR